jgi:hypothetical protein
MARGWGGRRGVERRRGGWATERMERDDEERIEWGDRQWAVQRATKAYILVDGELAAVRHAQFAHLAVVDLAEMQLRSTCICEVRKQ